MGDCLEYALEADAPTFAAYLERIFVEEEAVKSEGDRELFRHRVGIYENDDLRQEQSRQLGLLLHMLAEMPGGRGLAVAAAVRTCSVRHREDPRLSGTWSTT